MCRMISCLVDRSGKVHAVDGVYSHSEIAARLGVDEDKCLKYEFHLDTRTLFQDFDSGNAPFSAKASHDKAAQTFFNECAGGVDRLIAYVRRGNFDEQVLSLLLNMTASKACDEACDLAWNAYKEACALAWIDLFSERENRIPIWK